MPYVSPTLLDSFSYYMRIDNEKKSIQARRELIDRLKGVRTLPNEAMLRGIAFEDNVCAYCDGTYKPVKADYDACVREAAGYVAGARRQVYIDFPLIDDISVNGYIDFLSPGVITDTKTTGEYEFGKYLRNTQHLAYLTWGEPKGYRCFQYVVMDFKRMNVVREEYFWNPVMRDNLCTKALTFTDYLECDAEMKQAFLEHKPYRREEN